MSRYRDLGSFLLLCLIWGSTWIGIKAGVAAVPPLFLAGSRFTTAGVILSTMVVAREGWFVKRGDLPRLAVAALMMIAVCYGCLFWGMLFVDSGTAAVLEMGLTPVALLGFALLLGEERGTLRKFLAIALGIGGLVVLFGPTAMVAWTAADSNAGRRALGAIAVASAALAYGWGSVIARPLLRVYPAMLVSGATTLIGGMFLLAASFALEPGASDALRGNWGATAWAGWLFLVIFGSLVGYSIYMRLLRDIGASRAGMYAFVSPAIAVLLGAWAMGETVTRLDIVGMAILLVAAWLAMSKPELA